MNAQLFLDACRTDGVAGAVSEIGAAQKQRKTGKTIVARARQHKMQDAVREVLITAGNEDFLAGYAPDIAIPFRAALDPGKIRPGTGLRQRHGGEPFATGKLRDIRCLLLRRSEIEQRACLPWHQAGGHFKGMVRGGENFRCDPECQPAEALTAILLRD